MARKSSQQKADEVFAAMLPLYWFQSSGHGQRKWHGHLDRKRSGTGYRAKVIQSYKGLWVSYVWEGLASTLNWRTVGTFTTAEEAKLAAVEELRRLGVI